MARPREIVLEQGKVYMQGFPKEVADKIESHIKDFNKPPHLVEVVKEGTFEIKSELKEKALGLKHNVEKNKYELVTVAYNPITKEALVETIDVFDYRKDAIVAFKVNSGKLNFI